MTEFNANAKPSLGRLATEMKLHEKLVLGGILPSCHGCMWWGMNGKPKEEVCTLYKARPPAETIVFGCEKYEWDIPF